MTRKSNSWVFWSDGLQTALTEISQFRGRANYYIAIFIYALIFTFEVLKCS